MAENSYYLLDECFPEVLMEHHLHAKDSSLVNTLVKFLFKWLISSSAIFKLNNNCDCGYQICMIWLQSPREIHIMLSIYHADFFKKEIMGFTAWTTNSATSNKANSANRCEHCIDTIRWTLPISDKSLILYKVLRAKLQRNWLEIGDNFSMLATELRSWWHLLDAGAKR